MFYSFYENAEYSMEDDLRYLKLYSKYNHAENEKTSVLKFSFDLNSPGLTQIKEKWYIDYIMGLGTEIQRIVKLKNGRLICYVSMVKNLRAGVTNLLIVLKLSKLPKMTATH